MNVMPKRSLSRVEDGGFFQRMSTAAVRIRKDGSVWIKSGPTAIFAYSRKTLCRSSKISWGTVSRVPICVCKALRQDITTHQPDFSELSVIAKQITVTVVASNYIETWGNAWRARRDEPRKRLSFVRGEKWMTETLYLVNSIFAVEVVHQFRWLVLTKACSLYDDDINVT